MSAIEPRSGRSCVCGSVEYFDDPAAYDSPADCLGDMGAASGPLFAMLACRATVRRIRQGPDYSDMGQL